jgi:hypothetical protein
VEKIQEPETGGSQFRACNSNDTIGDYESSVITSAVALRVEQTLQRASFDPGNGSSSEADV